MARAFVWLDAKMVAKQLNSHLARAIKTDTNTNHIMLIWTWRRIVQQPAESSAFSVSYQKDSFLLWCGWLISSANSHHRYHWYSNICIYLRIYKRYIILSNIHFRHNIASYLVYFCTTSKNSSRRTHIKNQPHLRTMHNSSVLFLNKSVLWMIQSLSHKYTFISEWISIVERISWMNDWWLFLKSHTLWVGTSFE